ncbi:RNA polymerase sigma factor SigX [Rossellomorea sp. BNER]|uniref:RNA polymerase sigma factor SigX n=1 Tax=Rossellomorea sp. BNER TaxID=2962031 RepID=UPI003AF2D719|nr:RNA polymerase sigma factor SigX [Rossellomorea sp. BNER]
MDSVFEELYEKYHHDVFQFLLYMVRDREQAEDLVQEVYIRVMKSYQNFQGKSSEKTWLFSIAKNVAIDYFRKQKGWKNKILEKFDWNRQQIKDEAVLPEEVAEQKEEVRVLYECLEHCTTDQRLVIVMRYIQDLSISEASSILGWTESKVKTTQHRAVKALRDMMNEKIRKEESEHESIKMGRS